MKPQGNRFKLHDHHGVGVHGYRLTSDLLAEGDQKREKMVDTKSIVWNWTPLCSTGLFTCTNPTAYFFSCLTNEKNRCVGIEHHYHLCAIHNDLSLPELQNYHSGQLSTTGRQRDAEVPRNGEDTSAVSPPVLAIFDKGRPKSHDKWHESVS